MRQVQDNRKMDISTISLGYARIMALPDLANASSQESVQFCLAPWTLQSIVESAYLHINSQQDQFKRLDEVPCSKKRLNSPVDKPHRYNNKSTTLPKPVF